jgi:hypothetical protein
LDTVTGQGHSPPFTVNYGAELILSSAPLLYGIPNREPATKFRGSFPLCPQECALLTVAVISDDANPDHKILGNLEEITAIAPAIVWPYQF